MKFSTDGLSVGLVMPVHRDLDWRVCKSLVETQALFQTKNIPFRITLQVGSSIIEAARSRAAHQFMQDDCTRLFWVDSDIAWKPADFLTLALYSTKKGMDVVCGAYCAKAEPPSFAFAGFEGQTSNEYGCLETKGLGLGFTCVHRKIIEELSAKAQKLKFPDMPDPIPHFFRCDTDNGEFRGEDIAFFSDVRALGYKVWLDPSVTLQHIGSKAYSASLLDMMLTEPVA